MAIGISQYRQCHAVYVGGWVKIILAGLAVPGSSWAADPRRTLPAALWHSQFSLGPDILGKAAFH